MKTGELLERDKERLLSQLAKADTPDSAIAVMEEELNRILYQYNEKCTDERESAAAAHALRLAVRQNGSGKPLSTKGVL